jgi:hypothetical protein
MRSPGRALRPGRLARDSLPRSREVKEGFENLHIVRTFSAGGYLVSFEPPSLYSALTTLKRANKNKNYIKTLYPEISGSWDGWGRCEEILLDNAWLYKSPSFQHLLANLGISVVWAPVRTGQYQAIGERFFRTLNILLFHRLAGGVPYNPVVMRQVGLDPTTDSILTLGDLDALIHEAIIVYQNEKHEGLGAIPARIWRDKIAIHKRHFIADITALDHVLGRVETAQLTTSGIRFKYMTFHDPEITSALLDDLVKEASVRSQSDKTYAPGRVNVRHQMESRRCVFDLGVAPRRITSRCPTATKNSSRASRSGTGIRSTSSPKSRISISTARPTAGRRATTSASTTKNRPAIRTGRDD